MPTTPVAAIEAVRGNSCAPIDNVAGVSDRTYRSTIFGEAADHYDAVRPGYFDATIDRVLAYADLGDLPAVEVGAGTGKATAHFAGRGIPIVCVEPDPRMAEVLRRNTAAYPAVSVEISRFEDWSPGERRFGLLYASASWNWVDPGPGWTKVYESLVPGGAIAILGNPVRVVDRVLLAELAAIDETCGIHDGGHADDLAHDPGLLDPEATDLEPHDRRRWPADQIDDDPRFTDIRVLHTAESRTVTTAEYLAYLASISAYRILPEAARARAFTEIAAALDARGGTTELSQLNGAILARTTA
jgi:SAM-dependent methyltransferase